MSSMVSFPALSNDIRMMMSICQRLNITHRLVCDWPTQGLTGPYTVKFLVADACDKTGFVEVLRFEGLIQWLVAKGFKEAAK